MSARRKVLVKKTVIPATKPQKTNNQRPTSSEKLKFSSEEVCQELEKSFEPPTKKSTFYQLTKRKLDVSPEPSESVSGISTRPGGQTLQPLPESRGDDSPSKYTRSKTSAALMSSTPARHSLADQVMECGDLDPLSKTVRESLDLTMMENYPNPETAFNSPIMGQGPPVNEHMCPLRADVDVDFRSALSDFRRDLDASEIRMRKFMREVVDEAVERIEDKFANTAVLAAAASSRTTKKRNTAEKVEICAELRRQVRIGVSKAMGDGDMSWKLGEKQGPYTPENLATTSWATEYARAHYEGNFNISHVRQAMHTHFQTRQAERRRAMDGTKKLQSDQSKQARRKAAKRTKRAKALDSITWPKDRKDRYRRACRDYSLTSTDTDDTDGGKDILAAHPRQWESQELRSEKAELDAFELKMASKASRSQRLNTGYEAGPSTCARPETKRDADAWLFA